MPEADPFADPIAPRITVSHPYPNMPEYVTPGLSIYIYSSMRTYRPETAEERHGPSETDRDIRGPIVMPLPSYGVSHSKPIHQIPSNSNFRDRDTGRFGIPAETESVFTCVTFFFLNLFSVFAAKLFPFFLAQARLANINSRPILILIRTRTRARLCLLLLSSLPLPNQRLPMGTPTLGTHIQVLIPNSITSAG